MTFVTYHHFQQIRPRCRGGGYCRGRRGQAVSEFDALVTALKVQLSDSAFGLPPFLLSLLCSNTLVLCVYFASLGDKVRDASDTYRDLALS
jgi:hypothetical protein